MSDAAIAALEADERRHARDSWRAAGGSKSRPLKSFTTKRERREAREDHAARIHAAVDELADSRGFEAWIEALALNPQLSPMNAALVALQSPGEIVGTAASWRKQGYKVRKGERCAGRITGGQFRPLAYFTAPQAQATDLEGFEPELPDAVTLERLSESLSARLAAGEKPVPALWAVAIEAGFREPDDMPADPPKRERRAKPAPKPVDSRPEPVDVAALVGEIRQRREQLDREREAIDADIGRLVRAAQDAPDVSVSGIAAELGLSRARLYQLAGGAD